MESLAVRVPRPRAIGLLLLALVLLVLTARSDPAGRLLAGPGGIAALVLGGWELASGPVLLADASGLRVRQGWRRFQAPWDAVTGMRVRRDRRTELLEIELEGDLAVLTRAQLGRLPADVLADLVLLRAGLRD